MLLIDSIRLLLEIIENSLIFLSKLNDDQETELNLPIVISFTKVLRIFAVRVEKD